MYQQQNYANSNRQHNQQVALVYQNQHQHQHQHQQNYSASNAEDTRLQAPPPPPARFPPDASDPIYANISAHHYIVGGRGDGGLGRGLDGTRARSRGARRGEGASKEAGGGREKTAAGVDQDEEDVSETGGGGGVVPAIVPETVSSRLLAQAAALQGSINSDLDTLD